MEDMYSLHHNSSVNCSSASDVVSSMSSSACSTPLLQENMQQLVSSINYQTLLLSSSLAFQDHHRVPIFGSDPFFSSANCNSVASTHEHHQTRTADHTHPEEEMTTMSMSMQKAKIAAHPRYPSLLQAYIDCQKVGAPTEVANMLDDIRRHHQDNIHGYFCSMQQHRNDLFSASRLGQDPELDNFMETYCDILMKYKMDLSRPFDEATSFLNKIELQLSHLSNSKSNQHHPAPPSSISTDPTCLSSDHEAGGGGSSEDEISGGDIEIHQNRQYNNQIVHQTTNRVEDRDLKDKLLRKYSGYISSLKQEFSKKKKKGKLPKEARQTLLNWWDIHNRWPYPTEADKMALAEATNLDQKQINNWFINHRKRHWKPSENMQFSVMDNL
ncbi:hypothetical protein MKW94_014831 [Papaver nudicaule]|uniref:Uncharacterized protein n=1 Tax=Papaver nudicaule TaxID=74823 RepID=A0AA41VW57_PAPNU|nr:hypothetical protein [Papaver nudicaule]